MDYEGVRRKVEMIVTGAFPADRVCYENVSFDEPEEQPWVKISIGLIDRGQISFGKNAKKRVDGNAFLDFFYPLGSGTKLALQAGEDNKDLFQSADGLIFKPSRLKIIGAYGSWYQVQLIFPWHYYEG